MTEDQGMQPSECQEAALIVALNRLDHLDLDGDHTPLNLESPQFKANLNASISSARELLEVGQSLLVNEEYHKLEFAMYRLWGLCSEQHFQRLSFIFEKCYYNLNRFQTVLLSKMLTLAKRELDELQIAVNELDGAESSAQFHVA